jgi:hypothetical protein
MGTREIVIPHDLTRGPLQGIRRMIVHSSLMDLKEFGYYERYRPHMHPSELAEVSDAIGPGWLPLEFVLAHYRACDLIGLTDEEITNIGKRSGAKMQATLLLGLNKAVPELRSPWETIGALSRMGRRVYEGGSSQFVKLGSKELLIENIRNPLFSFRYYRIAHVAFLREAFSAFGVEIKDVKPISFNRDGDKAEVRITWL